VFVKKGCGGAFFGSREQTCPLAALRGWSQEASRLARRDRLQSQAGSRARATAGGKEGRPRRSRRSCAVSGSVTNSTTRRIPPHGQARTSNE